MRLAVIGAGIVGVTTAYELASDGHEVTVYERHSAVASGTSFANAGVLAPGYVTPWAAPGMSWKVLQQVFSRDAAVRFSGASWLRELPWMWRWWRACRAVVHQPNRAAMLRLAQFSRTRQLDITRKLQLDYEQREGYMVLLRSERELAAAQGGIKQLAELGVAFELVDAARARQIEPGLHAGTALAGAIHLAQDGVANCRQFTHLVKAEAQRLGVNFRFDIDVQRVVAGPQVLLQVGRPVGSADGDTQIDAPPPFDAVVVCAGPQAAGLLAPLGLKLPIAPVFGYSVTAPLRHLDGQSDMGPQSAVMDEKYKVAISRLGQRVRVAGSAELGGSLSTMNANALQTLYRVLDDWFPGVAATHKAQSWKGARPMLPDGPPLVCASGQPGVWLNVGHGSSGWALSCGSARLLADLLAGREAPIDVAGLNLQRWR